MLQKNILASILEEAKDKMPCYGIYKDSDQLNYYAYFIDDKQQVVFVSKPYSTRYHCESALKSVEEGDYTSEIREDEQGLYIEFRRDSGTLIGTSPTFKSRRAVERSLSFLSGFPAEQPASTNIVEGENTDDPPRHAFRLEFYPADGNAFRRGRIEYTLTGDSTAFQGIDTELIRSFIEKYLRSSKPEGHRIPSKADGRILFLEYGKPMDRTVLMTDQLKEVLFDIPDTEGKEYEAFVYAKPYNQEEEILVGRKNGDTLPVRIKVFADGLPSGLYRLEGTIYFPDDESVAYALSSKPFHFVAETSPAETVLN